MSDALIVSLLWLGFVVIAYVLGWLHCDDYHRKKICQKD